MSRFDLDGRVALITGGGAGIGLATARGLVQRNASVVLVDREEDAVERAASSLGDRAIAVTADVTDTEGMAAAVGRAAEFFGRLDIVVANAGITPPPATLRQLAIEDFARVISVNVLGVMNTIQPAAEHLISRSGQIAVIASAAAYSPPLGGAAYMVSKAATEVLARGFRLELAPLGVGVTTVAFGFVDTELARATLDDPEVGSTIGGMVPWPLDRRITPEQAANAVIGGIEKRASRVTRPAAWAPLGVLRGVVSPALDAALIRTGRLGPLVSLLEQETKR
jgi:NAD(P)-dependent dehydrogenase (short-subunit alcohol dehydrogenase family)